MKRIVRLLLPLCAALIVAACGGGGDKTTAVTNMAATNLTYGRTANVNVNGSGLTADGVTMTVEGACTNVARANGASESFVTFTCKVETAGPLRMRVVDAEGRELGRLSVTVPNPQVTMGVRQGTRSGTFVIELDPVAAPITVANFMAYLADGFYTNTLFHRVLEGTIAQGGGYDEFLTLKANSREPIVLESNNGLKNLRGTIAMARQQLPDTATSQFYLNLKDNPEFDRINDDNPGYAVFGRIVSGIEVADEIGKVPTRFVAFNLANVPVQSVVLTLAVQTR